MTRAVKSGASVAELLDRIYDDEALEELVRRKAQAASLAAGRIRRLKPGLSVETGWLCRVLGAVASDPLGILLSLLPDADYPKYQSLTIAVQRLARPDDERRLLDSLHSLVPAAFQPSGTCELPETLGQASGMAAVMILLEILARLNAASIQRPARALFAAARARLPKPSKKESFASASRKADSLPLLAAAAAVLLASAEAGENATNKERETWESACVQAALDPAMYPIAFSFNPPLSFLFVGSPTLAGRLVARLMKDADDAGNILPRIGSALREARESGLSLSLHLPSGAGSEPAQQLDEMVGHAGEWGVFADIPAWAAMEIRRCQSPETVEPHVLNLFRDAMIETSLVQDAADQLTDLVTPATFPAIAVEVMFAKRTSEKSFASLREKAEERLNRQLKAAGIAMFKGFSWEAPQGKRHTIHELTCLEALEETLRAIHSTIHDAGAASPAGAPSRKDSAAFLRNVFPHTLCRHAIYRNLACELSRRPADRYPELLALLPGADMERDAGMIRMIASLIGKGKPEPVNALLVGFLDSPHVRGDMKCIELIVSSLARAPLPAFSTPLKALKQHLIDAVPADTPNRSGAVQAVDELLLALGTGDTVASCLKRLAGKGFVSAEERMTLLRLAAAGSVTIGQDLFEKLFSEEIESEHLTYTGWTAAITGDQVREYILKILRDRTSPDTKVISVAKYCFWARKDGIPAAALAPILARLGPAVAAARTSPGEAWEDRNWGGYNASGSEDLADALTLAVKGLAERDSRAVGWPELVRELAGAAAIDLTKIPLGESTCSGFAFSTMNLLARLSPKIIRLNDPALLKAFKALATKPSS